MPSLVDFFQLEAISDTLLLMYPTFEPSTEFILRQECKQRVKFLFPEIMEPKFSYIDPKLILIAIEGLKTLEFRIGGITKNIDIMCLISVCYFLTRGHIFIEEEKLQDLFDQIGFVSYFILWTRNEYYDLFYLMFSKSKIQLGICYRNFFLKILIYLFKIKDFALINLIVKNHFYSTFLFEEGNSFPNFEEYAEWNKDNTIKFKYLNKVSHLTRIFEPSTYSEMLTLSETYRSLVDNFENLPDFNSKEIPEILEILLNLLKERKSNSSLSI